MKPIFGDLAILTDAHPLNPRVTIRLASPEDPACNCGESAAFVLLEADRAVHPPRMPNLEDRAASAWLHMHESVCTNHFAIAVRDVSRTISRLGERISP